MTGTVPRAAPGHDDLWRPVADCDAACLPPGAPQVGRLTRVLRALGGAAVLSGGLLSPWLAAASARALLRVLGIRLRVTGPAVAPGTLLVGNHVSWLDIVVLTALDRRMWQVAKEEVADWPLIGRIARRNGTIFVDRSRPRALPGTVAEVARALRAGRTVQVFPEGTTTCGPHPVRWRAAFLQAAIDADAPVQPFTLRYTHPAAAFVADQTLVESLRAVLAARGLSVCVLMGPPRAAGPDRRAMAAALSGRLAGARLPAALQPVLPRPPRTPSALSPTALSPTIRSPTIRSQLFASAAKPARRLSASVQDMHSGRGANGG